MIALRSGLEESRAAETMPLRRLRSSAASAKSHSRHALIFGSIAVACGQTIQYVFDNRNARKNGLTSRAELGQLVSGAKPGRQTAGEITIFDSTGTGIQDVAAGARGL